MVHGTPIACLELQLQAGGMTDVEPAERTNLERIHHSPQRLRLQQAVLGIHGRVQVKCGRTNIAQS